MLSLSPKPHLTSSSLGRLATLIGATIVIVAWTMNARESNAQPNNPPFQIQLGDASAGGLVISVPPGAPPFNLDLGNQTVVSLPGQPPTSVSGNATVSFPSGGKVTIPCGGKRVIITGSAPVFRLMKPTTPVTSAPKKN